MAGVTSPSFALGPSFPLRVDIFPGHAVTDLRTGVGAMISGGPGEGPASDRGWSLQQTVKGRHIYKGGGNLKLSPSIARVTDVGWDQEMGSQS